MGNRNLFSVVIAIILVGVVGGCGEIKDFQKDITPFPQIIEAQGIHYDKGKPWAIGGRKVKGLYNIFLQSRKI